MTLEERCSSTIGRVLLCVPEVRLSQFSGVG